MRIHLERQGAAWRGDDAAPPQWLRRAIGVDRSLVERRTGQVGVPAFAPGDAYLVCHRADLRVPIPSLVAPVPPGRVIVLSDAQDESTIVATLEAGAHHYFSIDESNRLLAARLSAALREHRSLVLQSLVVDPFRFDLGRRLAFRNDTRIELSPREFEFAYYLFANRDRSITDEELMRSVWTLPRAMGTRRIDTAACRLRKKMPLDGVAGWILHRARGSGYELQHVDYRRVDL